MTTLAYFYDHGVNNNLDNDKAFQLWKTAASSDYLPAISCHSCCFMENLGTPRDYSLALHCLHIYASDRGHVEAMLCNLGNLSVFTIMAME